MVDYSVDMLNPNDLEHSFLRLDRQDPTVGLMYDATGFYGPTWPGDGDPQAPLSRSLDLLRMRLLVASHLAGYLRHQLESCKGYAATVGISTSKLLAKLAGSVHKPNSQTTLLPPYVVAGAEPESSIASGNVIRFIDGHEIRKIPGIGSKLAHKLHAHLARSIDEPVTVREVRRFPGMGPELLNRILGGSGSSKGIGARIWGLIHGVDESEVLEARDVPTQISIEDSYGRLDRLEVVKTELTKLAASLLRRMRTDLTEKDPNSDSAVRWRTHPRTLRLSSRLRRPSNPDNPYYNRSSRSAPLPRYVYNLDDRVEVLAERLVQEHALVLFRRLHPEKNGWNLSLLNIAVTNMAESAGEERRHNGRDIGTMFRKQETVLSETPETPEAVPEDQAIEEEEEEPWEDSEEESMPSAQCRTCGGWMPCFALEAHEEYHKALTE